MQVIQYIYIIVLFISVQPRSIAQDYIPQELNGKWGFINTSKEWVIKPKFVAANKFSEGLAAVQKGIKWGFINTNGDFVVKPIYGYVNDFKEGKAAVLSFKPLEGATREDKLKHKWGFINKTGEMIIPYSFRNIFSFENGIALVANWGQRDKELYMINEEGEAVSPSFLNKEKMSYGFLKIKNIRINGDSTYKYITPKGESKTDWYLNNFEFSNFPVKVYLPSDLRNDTIATTAFKGDSRKKLCAMMNEKGEIITPWFNTIGNFTYGYAPAQHNRSWGIIDENFKWAVQPIYQDIELLEKGYYQAQIDITRSLLLNEKGDILSEEIENIEVFDTSFHQMSYFDKLGKREITFKALFDKTGEQRTGWYQNINEFHNNITRIEEEKRSLFPNDSIGLHNWYNYAIDSTGDVISIWRAENKILWDNSFRKYKDSILNFIFAPEVSFHLTQEYFKTTYNKDFSLDAKNGALLFQGGNFREGMALISKKIGSKTKKVKDLEFTLDDVRYGYINWLGKQVIPYKYEEAANFSDGKAIIATNNKYGAIDYTGKIIIKPQYQLMGNFGNNLAPVFIDSLWGYVNSKNNMTIKPQFDEALPFNFGYASVKKGKEWGVINTQGILILDYNYRKAPIPKSTSTIEILQKGEGYQIIDL